MSDNQRLLNRGADEIHMLYDEIAKKQVQRYRLSILGNIFGALATITATGSSDFLSSIFYIGKYMIMIFNRKSIKQEMKNCETKIEGIYTRVIRQINLQNPNQQFSTNPIPSRCSLSYSVPFSLILDIIYQWISREKKLAITENLGRLDHFVTATGEAVTMQRKEIEHLTPMLKEVKHAIENIKDKTVPVVKFIPGIIVPESKDFDNALYEKRFKMHVNPLFRRPMSKKNYMHLKREIVVAVENKKGFEKSAYDVLNSARKCLQTSHEAKRFPTFILAQSHGKNLELLEDTKKNLDVMKNVGREFQHLLQLDKQKNQHTIAAGVTTLLENANETLTNVSEFDIDVKSKLERSSVKMAAKKVQDYARKGGRINHQVDETVTSMKKANEAIKTVEQNTSWFWGRIKINEIKQQQKGTEKIWHDESMELAKSVDVLARHAEEVLHSPENILKGTFVNYKPKMVEQATDMATEALNIYDQVEKCNSNLDGQLRVLQRMFQRVWSSNEEATEMQLEVVNMRSEARKLRMRVPGDETLFNKFQAALRPVDRLSLLISIFCIGFDTFHLFRIQPMHPKEKVLRDELRKMIGDDGQVSG